LEDKEGELILEFRNDITPEDYGLIDHLPKLIIVYSESEKNKPFIVEVLDTDPWGWGSGILYEVRTKDYLCKFKEYISTWPKHWFWAEWEEK
jgi:hypothetical protein